MGQLDEVFEHWRRELAMLAARKGLLLMDVTATFGDGPVVFDADFAARETGGLTLALTATPEQISAFLARLSDE